jgi:hypothetical protein
MAAALGRQPDLFDLRALNRLAGTFRDGHTSEDVSAVAASLSPALGRPETLCVVWAYTGEWGPAGDSETFFRDGDQLLIMPVELAELLYEGRQLERDDVLSVYQHLDERPLVPIDNGLIEVDRANFARQDGDPAF